jgi:hypothetical protein
MGKREVNQPTPGTACFFVSVYSCNGSILPINNYTAAVHRMIFLFILIKVHDLIGSFALARAGQIEILWWEFFLDHFAMVPNDTSRR